MFFDSFKTTQKIIDMRKSFFPWKYYWRIYYYYIGWYFTTLYQPYIYAELQISFILPI